MLLTLSSLIIGLCAVSESPEATTLEVKSTLDGTLQPALFTPSPKEGPQPLLVLLHPWSHGYNTFDLTDWQAETAKRGWHLLQPHFRGPNNNPDACGSPLARQDILDATQYVCDHYPVDPARIYLAGGSGGGHMSLVMAGHAPERWTAVSAWCPISDLAAWHRECAETGRKYAGDIEGAVGGAPGASPEVDKQLEYRSPVHHLAKAKDLPLEIATGIHDGHTSGSVPIHHTLDAFNVIARARGDAEVTAEEIATLTQEKPLSSEEEQDPTFERKIHLRRYAGPCRVSIFEGGHEALPKPALAWLEQHRKPAAE